MAKMFGNPFKPGAGHKPPYLAGRKEERLQFDKLLSQPGGVIENLILTGLRGVGKTVLLEELKPQAMAAGWLWAGSDLSESSSVSEMRMAQRVLTDLAVLTSNLEWKVSVPTTGFDSRTEVRRLDVGALQSIYDMTPGLASDKLKNLVSQVWSALHKAHGAKGLVLAYDEAQTIGDQPKKEEYPLSMLLDVFQSIQRQGVPVMLVLTGLPILFPKLVEARTFAERMFHVQTLRSLNWDETREAVLKPIAAAECPVKLNPKSVENVFKLSGGYPYFIQFICREVYDTFLQSDKPVPVPVHEIEAKLDASFFQGRWARATDRQRELLSIVAQLDSCDEEFTVQEIVQASQASGKKVFSSSHANQMLAALSGEGLVFKNRHGKYSFAVPLMGRFIRREMKLPGKVSS
jgi:hypothetical protein